MSQAGARRIVMEGLREDRACHLTALRWRSDSEARAISCCSGVIDLVSTLVGVPGREMRLRTRGSADAAQARQLAMYVAHVILRLTMREVAIGFGRNRASVVYACHLIEDMRDDVEFDRLVLLAERVVAAAFATSQES